MCLYLLMHAFLCVHELAASVMSPWCHVVPAAYSEHAYVAWQLPSSGARAITGLCVFRCKVEVGQVHKTELGEVTLDNRCWIRNGHTLTQVSAGNLCCVCAHLHGVCTPHLRWICTVSALCAVSARCVCFLPRPGSCAW